MSPCRTAEWSLYALPARRRRYRLLARRNATMWRRRLASCSLVDALDEHGSVQQCRLQPAVEVLLQQRRSKKLLPSVDGPPASFFPYHHLSRSSPPEAQSSMDLALSDDDRDLQSTGFDILADAHAREAENLNEFIDIFYQSQDPARRYELDVLARFYLVHARVPVKPEDTAYDVMLKLYNRSLDLTRGIAYPPPPIPLPPLPAKTPLTPSKRIQNSDKYPEANTAASSHASSSTATHAPQQELRKATSGV